MSDDLIYNADDSLAKITFNQAARGNAFSDEMTESLTALVRRAERTEKLILLVADGADFCVGRIPGGPRASDPLDRRDRGDIIFNCYSALSECRIPTVAVVRGRAFGFGCAVAASCDVTFAAQTATFALPEMAHNVMPGNALSALVANTSRRAMTFLALSTQPVSADTAMAAGLVSQVLPDATLDSGVERFLSRVLTMPQAAVEAVKAYASMAPELGSKGAVQLARNLHAAVNTSSRLKKPSGGRDH